MSGTSFKERVKNEAIQAVSVYKKNFVDYEYLMCSDAFSMKNYYIIAAKPDNYQHLIGVNSLLSPQDFYDKCCNGTLQETDFNFIRKNQSERSVKGSVREKILALQNISNLFQNGIMAQENFIKNKIFCQIATTDNKCTLGFIDASKSRPKSLLKGNQLDAAKAKRVRLLLRKHVSKKKFDEMIIGDSKTLIEYYQKIKDYIDNNLLPKELRYDLDETG